MSEFKFKQVYIRQMRIDRRELVRDAIRQDLSRRETLIYFRNSIDRIYIINDWKDAYSMMRDYRQRAIDRGEYPLPERKSHHPLSSGDPEGYKRYREKVSGHALKLKARRERMKLARTSPVGRRQWIAELDISIASATGKRREQLIKQRDRLQEL